ncbi:MAG TPA: hypothetical protein VMP01_21720 [Pirellulaceae bacterium]|nr:hypothetical protein [Pirellulaceae bacterium]
MFNSRPTSRKQASKLQVAIIRNRAIGMLDLNVVVLTHEGAIAAPFLELANCGDYLTAAGGAQRGSFGYAEIERVI